MGFLWFPEHFPVNRPSEYYKHTIYAPWMEDVLPHKMKPVYIDVRNNRNIILHYIYIHVNTWGTCELLMCFIENIDIVYH